MSAPIRLFIALYLDENVALRIIPPLIEKGYDVLSAHAAEMLGESDRRQLEFAISQQGAIVTHNRDDFLELHSRYVAVQGALRYHHC